MVSRIGGCCRELIGGLGVGSGRRALGRHVHGGLVANSGALAVGCGFGVSPRPGKGIGKSKTGAQ